LRRKPDLNVIAGAPLARISGYKPGWQVRVATLLADINGEYTPLYFNLMQGATPACPVVVAPT